MFVFCSDVVLRSVRLCWSWYQVNQNRDTMYDRFVPLYPPLFEKYFSVPGTSAQVERVFFLTGMDFLRDHIAQN